MQGGNIMQIRPVSDLRNKFPEVEKIVENGEPVYLTKNGYGSMVVMSIEEYEKLTQRAKFISEFEVLVGEAKNEIRFHPDAEQVIVVRTTKKRIRSFVFHSMEEIVQEDNVFVRQLVDQDDVEIDYIVCMWNNYGLDMPSIAFRKCLLEASSKNEETLMVLQGEYDFTIRSMKSTM